MGPKKRDTNVGMESVFRMMILGDPKKALRLITNRTKAFSLISKMFFCFG